MTIFDAARAGDLAGVRAALDAGASASGTDDADGDPGQIAREAVEALRARGLAVQWDGDDDRRIEVAPG